MAIYQSQYSLEMLLQNETLLKLVLPEGIPPFTDTEFTLQAEADARPFLRLESAASDLAFHLLDINEILEHYGAELFQKDLDFLGLASAGEALFLGIVNLKRGARDATVNLASPIALNPQSARAKQTILRNAAEYSVRHRLFPA